MILLGTGRSLESDDSTKSDLSFLSTTVARQSFSSFVPSFALFCILSAPYRTLLIEKFDAIPIEQLESTISQSYETENRTAGTVIDEFLYFLDATAMYAVMQLESSIVLAQLAVGKCNK